MTNEQRDRMLDRLLENQAHHDAILQKLEESQSHHDAILQKLEELQMTDHLAISRLNSLMAAMAEQQQAFMEQHHQALLEIDNRLIRLESLVEAFIRGSRHNGGRRKS